MVVVVEVEKEEGRHHGKPVSSGGTPVADLRFFLP